MSGANRRGRPKGGKPGRAGPPKIEFTRRRYPGQTTYCWAVVIAPDGTRLDLGDPWPGTNWPNDVLEPLARAALARHGGQEEAAEAATQEAIEAERKRVAQRHRATETPGNTNLRRA